MTVSLIEPTEAALLHVAENMRADDAREIFATRWSDYPDDVVRSILGTPWPRYVFAFDGFPTCAIGAMQLWPGMWSVWMFATDDWPRVALSVTKHARRVMMPDLVKAGARRASCASLDTHHSAHRWLESLGAEFDATMPGYGKGGETFFLFSWERANVLSL